MVHRTRFVSFEGIDGSGKTTQARRLAELIRSRGQDAVLTREPGGAPGAEAIRRLLVEGEPDRWSPETEILLFTAARRDHLEHTILPALTAGAWVVSDRFADSTRVYQGVARAELRGVVDRLHAEAIGVEPACTILIDVDCAVATARVVGRKGIEDRFERFGADFQRRLRDGFLALAAEAPDRIRVVDGSGSEADVAALVRCAFDAACA